MYNLEKWRGCQDFAYKKNCSFKIYSKCNGGNVQFKERKQFGVGARLHTYKIAVSKYFKGNKDTVQFKGGWGAVAWKQELSQVIEREAILEEKTGGSAEMTHLLNASEYSMQVLC